MDINLLLKGEQISLMRVRTADSTGARAADLARARCYGARQQQTKYPHTDLPFTYGGS